MPQFFVLLLLQRLQNTSKQSSVTQLSRNEHHILASRFRFLQYHRKLPKKIVQFNMAEPRRLCATTCRHIEKKYPRNDRTYEGWSGTVVLFARNLRLPSSPWYSFFPCLAFLRCFFCWIEVPCIFLEARSTRIAASHMSSGSYAWKISCEANAFIVNRAYIMYSIALLILQSRPHPCTDQNR